jgi:hypothetical protein
MSIRDQEAWERTINRHDRGELPLAKDVPGALRYCDKYNKADGTTIRLLEPYIVTRQEAHP